MSKVDRIGDWAARHYWAWTTALVTLIFAGTLYLWYSEGRKGPFIGSVCGFGLGVGTVSLIIALNELRDEWKRRRED